MTNNMARVPPLVHSTTREDITNQLLKKPNATQNPSRHSTPGSHRQPSEQVYEHQLSFTCKCVACGCLCPWLQELQPNSVPLYSNIQVGIPSLEPIVGLKQWIHLGGNTNPKFIIHYLMTFLFSFSIKYANHWKVVF